MLYATMHMRANDDVEVLDTADAVAFRAEDSADLMVFVRDSSDAYRIAAAFQELAVRMGAQAMLPETEAEPTHA